MKLTDLLRILAAIAIIFAAIGPSVSALHSHQHAPAPSAACDDEGTHLAHHPDAPDLSTLDACPFCTLRVSSNALLDSPASGKPLTIACLGALLSPVPSRITPGLAFSRGPPTV